MKITIQNRSNPMGAKARREVRERVEASLSNFGHRISGVALWFDDENGPRGGIDQTCRVQVTMAPRVVAFGAAREEEQGVALQVALGRVKSRVQQIVARRRQHDARRVAEFDDLGRESA